MKNIRIYLILLLAIFLSSFSSVFSKIAARYELLSWRFLLFYGFALCILVGYSFIWQLCLEKIALINAYMLRGLLFVFVVLWSKYIFDESISMYQVIGIALIALGVGVSQLDGK